MTTLKKIIWEEDCDGPKRKIEKIINFFITSLFIGQNFLSGKTK